MERDQLRPFERAVLRLAEGGMSTGEIAWRFRRSPGHIDRVLALARLPRDIPRGGPAGELRPVERCVLRARSNGSDLAAIAARLRRSPGHVGRLEHYASYKLAKGATP